MHLSRITANIVKHNLVHNLLASVEAIFAMETIMEHIAEYLDLDPTQVKMENFYKQGEVSFPRFSRLVIVLNLKMFRIHGLKNGRRDNLMPTQA